jgi:hypothetical protein
MGKFLRIILESETREGKISKDVLTEIEKNEAQRAETHAKLRHEVRTDIAEDAKMSLYFEMLDDAGKEINNTIESNEEGEFVEIDTLSAVIKEQANNQNSESDISEGEYDEDDDDQEDEKEVNNNYNNDATTTITPTRKKKVFLASKRAMKKMKMKESVANKRAIIERLSHILRLSDANYAEVLTKNKIVIEEIRKKTQGSAQIFGKNAIETKKKFEKFLRSECLEKILKQNNQSLGKICEQIAQTEVQEIEKANALLTSREKEIDDLRERERTSVDTERDAMERNVEANETILRRLCVENSMHEDRLERIAKEFSAREKARRDRAAILYRQTKDEYRALSVAKRAYEETLVKYEYASKRVALRSKNAADKYIKEVSYY